MHKLTRHIFVFIFLYALLFNSCSSSDKKQTGGISKQKQLIYSRYLSKKLLNEAKVLYNIAYNHYINGSIRRAIEEYNNALKKLILIDNHLEIAKVYNNLGTIYIKIAKFDKAIKYLKMA
ncbi:MAG: tetratricopeptide repeat protein, partial [Spirochaetes bacterium]|nr:tetratricopeptide repeat protein [Spirochaetota bacterium]